MSLVKLGKRASALGGAAPFGGGGSPGSIGSFVVTGNTDVTTIDTVNVWETLDLGSGGVLGTDNRDWAIDVLAQGSLRYEGGGTFEGVVTAVLSGLSETGPIVCEFRVVREGAVLAEAFEQRVELDNTAERIIVLQVPLSGVENDKFVRVQVRNITNAEDVTFRNVTFRSSLIS